MSATEESSTSTALVLWEPDTTGDDALVVLEEIHTKLASITTVDDAKELANQAAAFERYAKRSAKGLAVQNRCAWVRLLAERRAGELLAQMHKLRGRPEKASTTTRLSDLGVSYDQSSRWQRLAAVPEETLKVWLDECDQSRAELTNAYVTRYLKSLLTSGYRDATLRWDADLETTRVEESWRQLFNDVRAFKHRLQGGKTYEAMFDVLGDRDTLSPFDINVLGDEVSECRREVDRYVDAAIRFASDKFGRNLIVPIFDSAETRLTIGRARFAGRARSAPARATPGVRNCRGLL